MLCLAAALLFKMKKILQVSLNTIWYVLIECKNTNYSADLEP